MNAVFLDSSFWVSYRRENDPRQMEASQIVERLFREKTSCLVTLPVVCEIYAAFSRNLNEREVILQDLWNNPVVRFEEISMQDQTNAIEILRSNRDKTYSLCDALSFAVMRRLGIRRVATFDRHFKQFGEFEIIS